MKQRQVQELISLNKIISEGSLYFWDGFNDGSRGIYREDRIRFVEGETHINPEILYFKINGGGEKGFKCGYLDEISRLNKLLKAKERYDLMMSMWIQDIKEGLLFFSELREDGWEKEADIIWDKLKKEGQQFHLTIPK